jgi:hypothetical protein
VFWLLISNWSCGPFYTAPKIRDLIPNIKGLEPPPPTPDVSAANVVIAPRHILYFVFCIFQLSQAEIRSLFQLPWGLEESAS